MYKYVQYPFGIITSELLSAGTYRNFALAGFSGEIFYITRHPSLAFLAIARP